MLNASTMIIACPACNTRYVVPDTAIGVDGRTVRCAKCKHSWFQDGPELVVPPPPEPKPEPLVEVASPPEPIAETAAPEPAPVVAEPDVPRPETAVAWAPPPDPAPEQTAPPPAFEHPAEEPDSPPPPLSYNDGAGLPSSDPRVSLADSYDDSSQFDYEPPFRARRNPAKMWTLAAALFAVVALGAVAATAWFGLPSWMPFAQPMFAEEQPGLKLDFPAKRQGQRQLPDRSWFFEANGTVTNISQTSRSVPAILVVLRDARERVVFTAEVTPPKRVLAPGESVSINEALVPVPKAAVKASYGWKPGS